MNTENSTSSDKPRNSGILSFDGQTVSYSSTHYGSFSVPIAEIAVIGEYTTENGPSIDDWFLVFIPRSGNEYFEASMFAEECHDVCQKIGEAIGGTLSKKLTFSTNFDSQVLWPPALAGRPLYIFTDELDETTGFWRRLWRRVFPRIIYRLSPDVLSLLDGGA